MLFEDQTTGQDGNQTQQTQTQEDWLAKIVEVKGEAFKDPQVLAKSKLESDNYIKQLESQLTDLRTELSKEDAAKKLLAELQSRRQDPNANSAPKQGETNPSDTKPVLSEDVIQRLVEETLSKREQANSAQQNAKMVQDQLTQKYGTEAKAHVEKKAQELGMSFDRLSALAAESPSAFMTLIGEPKTEFKAPVQGTINTAAGNYSNPSERNWDYYQNLRRTNKTLYFNPKTQQQMMQDKMRLGDRFGN
jgi:type VI protein secretion system component VasK